MSITKKDMLKKHISKEIERRLTVIMSSLTKSKPASTKDGFQEDSEAAKEERQEKLTKKRKI